MKGTPKGMKKLTTDFNKKSNPALYVNFKTTSTIPSRSAKKNPTPTSFPPKNFFPSNTSKPKKPPLAVDTKTNLGPNGSPKNKSFRNEKVAEYIKNNFFVKGSYFKNGNPYQTNTSANKTNKLKDELIRQMNKANMSTPEANNLAEKQSEAMIDKEDAATLTIELLLYVENRLNTIAQTMEKDFEIYDPIKEYVDVVQEHSFSEFFSNIKCSKIKLQVKNSMILERWTLFFIFWFYFNRDMAMQNLARLKELVQWIHKNILTYLKMLSSWISKFGNLEVRKDYPRLIIRR